MTIWPAVIIIAAWAVAFLWEAAPYINDTIQSARFNWKQQKVERKRRRSREAVRRKRTG